MAGTMATNDVHIHLYCVQYNTIYDLQSVQIAAVNRERWMALGCSKQNGNTRGDYTL